MATPGSPSGVPSAPTIAPVVPAGRSAAKAASRPPTQKSSAPVSAPAAAPASPTPPANPWALVFQQWPAEIPKRGIVISKLNEPTPFKGFMLKGGFVLLERQSPDSMGGRFLIIAFDEIAALKYTDPLKQAAFEAAGFQGSFAP